jgi:hypothetical protein
MLLVQDFSLRFIFLVLFFKARALLLFFKVKLPVLSFTAILLVIRSLPVFILQHQQVVQQAFSWALVF